MCDNKLSGRIRSHARTGGRERELVYGQKYRSLSHTPKKKQNGERANVSKYQPAPLPPPPAPQQQKFASVSVASAQLCADDILTAHSRTPILT